MDSSRIMRSTIKPTKKLNADDSIMLGGEGYRNRAKQRVKLRPLL